MEAMKKLTEEFNAAKKQLQTKGRTAFTEATKEIFEENSKLQSFGWEQYTPYFNDGDECVFSVYASCPTINGYSVYADEGNLTGLTDVEIGILHYTLEKLLTALPDEIMKDIFGDHRQITVSRGGKIEVEEYEHE